MFDEMYFLFDLEGKVSNKSNTDSQTASSSNPISDTQFKRVLSKDDVVETKKYTITNDTVKSNYIKSSVNAAYDGSKKNPYISLLEYFNGDQHPGLKLSSTDFAYLRDIGVMPINRLMILRRYPVGTVVPRDLNGFKTEPISTIVGWVKNESDFLTFSFSEEWRRQGKDEMLHLLINQMVSNEFGIGLDSIMPTPGWATGLVFGLLKNLKIVDDGTKLPLGDPNVLRESVTRPHEDSGFRTTFTFTVETTYEQKYIGGLDMTVATMDILRNALTMGTSDIRYIGRANSEIINNLRSATNDASNPSAWITLINSIVGGLINGLKETLNKFINTKSTPKTTTPEEEKTKQDVAQKRKEQEANMSEEDVKKLKDQEKSFSMLTEQFHNVTKGILSSTVGKYVWPLRGSIAMLTGEAATPWHLTIGNPYAPLLSLNNILVKDVTVTFTGEMQYNDIPKFIKVSVSIEQGRNMGKNEIYDSIGVEYQRKYDEAK